MAITVSTRPSEYSNSAIFVTSTSLSEDSSHVNLRIEAELYVDGVVIAKKVKPKGIETFDFTEILNSKIKFTNPAIDDSSTTILVDPGKIGSNLITGWTNDGFDTFTTSGANWTLLESNAGTAKAYTNNISVTNGYNYVILFKSTACDSGFSIQVKTTPANGNIITESAGTTTRMYFQARTTGTIALEFVITDTGGNYDYAGNWEMYILNACDWWCPYYVKFTEYFEDTSGTTTTGASSTETVLNLFFKSEGTLSDYLLYNNQKFLKTNGYHLNTNSRSYPLLKTPISGGRISNFEFFILDKRLYERSYKGQPYNAAGVAQTPVEGTIETQYCPINYFHFRENIISTYPRSDRSIIKATATECSENLSYYAVTETFCSNVHLIWLGSIGFSEYTFNYNIQKETQIEKEYYKDSNKKDRLIPDSVVTRNVIKAYTPISVTELQLDYIKEILYSPLVYWQRAADDLVQVTVKSDTITTKNDNELTPFQIEIEW